MPTRQINEVIRHQNILTAPGGLLVREACRRMAAAQVGSILIVNTAGALLGIFTERDALTRVLAAGLDPDATTLETVMTANPIVVEPSRPLGHALHLMHDGGFRHVPVVEDGHPMGMLSARDALGLELVAFEEELEQRDSITELL
ncbi:CBS domain-containing protein [Pseudothauera nasutitermitis]|uniref:CBS domain-containing protein n=1 Tax=Pseudothauera nasutitermitis TaxID=2565930 RepID=A0A4S4B1C8_9RHOO|nr:CBS domain-containing protein [Pseudothauera nasutitermitis]THF66249.1 CBS domain-containing protein [Pseudothauera nasutitermitis]